MKDQDMKERVVAAGGMQCPFGPGGGRAMAANLLRRYFQRYDQLPPGLFLLRLLLEQLLVTLVVGLLAAGLGIPSKERTDAEIPRFAWQAILIAPWLETLLLQMLPISVARVCGASRRTQMAVSTALFALPHFVISPFTGLTAGLIGGFYFSFAYTHWRRHSLARAFWMTVAQHMLYNACVCGFVLLILLRD